MNKTSISIRQKKYSSNIMNCYMCFLKKYYKENESRYIVINYIN